MEFGHSNSNMIGGRYQLIRLLGKGGSSRVYLAQDLRLGQVWAVKAVKDEDWSLYMREVRILQQLSHPGLVRVVDVIHESQVRYIIMDYVRGRTLRQVMREERLSEEVVLHWGIEVAEILVYLHKQEPAVVYRDMKPSNLILESEGHIKIIDLGICHRPGDVFIPLGTPGYAAPEQYDKSKGDISKKTDVYGLCMTLLALGSGIEPCGYDKRKKYIQKSKKHISKSFWRIIRKGIRSRPDKRYQDISVLHKRMQYLLSKKSRKQKKKQRQKVIWGIWAVIVLSILGVRNYNQTSRRNKVEKYRELTTGDSSEEKYIRAIELFPNHVEAYLGLLNAYLGDGTFTSSEEETMADLISVGGDRLKEDSHYQELAFQMGMAYSVYGEGDRRSQSVPWFMEAEVCGSDGRIQRLAGACAFLENFEQEVAADKNQDDEGHIYQELFDDMVMIIDAAKQEKTPELHIFVSREIAVKLRTYEDEMRRNGVEEGELNQLKADIQNLMS